MDADYYGVEEQFCKIMANPHYTEAEIEEAYQHWAWESSGSIEETAATLGIPQRTAYHWAKRDGWKERKRAEQADMAEPALAHAQVELKLGLSKVVSQLLADASNPKADHKNRLESQRLLFMLTFGSQFDMGKGASFISLTEAKHIHLSASESKATTPDDLRKLAARAIEANVSSVDSGKSKRNGSVRLA